VAGVTLLSLGNGAPDVFARVISFATAKAGAVVWASTMRSAARSSCPPVVAEVVTLAAGSRGGAVVELRGFVYAA
jgi:sodium/potassium/calcium exchanger 6